MTLVTSKSPPSSKSIPSQKSLHRSNEQASNVVWFLQVMMVIMMSMAMMRMMMKTTLNKSFPCCCPSKHHSQRPPEGRPRTFQGGLVSVKIRSKIMTLHIYGMYGDLM